MIVNTSIEGTARHLTELLPNVDLPDSFLQWQAQLLSHYSGHVFVPYGVETSTPTLWQAVLESSLAQLSMQAEISELRSQNESLKKEQQRLESEVKETEARSRRQEMLIQQQQKQQQFGSSSGPPKYFDRPSSPQRHFSSSTLYTSRPSSSRASTSTLNPFGPDPPSATKSSSSRAPGYPGSPPTPPSDRDDSIFYAMRLQHEFDREDRAHSNSPFANKSSSGRAPGHPDRVPTPPSDRGDSIFYAMRLQHEFDNENRALSAQRADLAKFTQRLFVCGICLEEMPDDSIARPDPCGHTFCRECLRGYVTARLNEHRFPILCPTCTADKGKGKGATGGMCRGRVVNSPINISPHYVSLRGLAVPCIKPRTHRRAIQYLDRDGNGCFLRSLKLSEVRRYCSPASLLY